MAYRHIFSRALIGDGRVPGDTTKADRPGALGWGQASALHFPVPASGFRHSPAWRLGRPDLGATAWTWLVESRLTFFPPDNSAWILAFAGITMVLRRPHKMMKMG